MSMTFSDGTAPIPGENYTSDTKNYPWHQPPRYSNLSDALDKMSVKLTDPKTARNLMAFAEAGFPLVRISQMIIMEGLSQGWWTLDMGLLMAGPVTKIIEIMCDSYGIDYDLGISDEDTWNTGNFMKAITLMQRDANTFKNVGQIVDQQMPQIEQAADGQSSPSEDNSPDGGGQAGSGSGSPDLTQQGFTTMQGGDPKNPSGGTPIKGSK